MYKAGDAVNVYQYVLDRRCTSGLRKKKVECGTVWKPLHKDQYGRDVYGVMTDSSNYVMSIVAELVGN